MSNQELTKEAFEKILRKSPKGYFWAPYDDLGPFHSLIKKEDGFTVDLFNSYQARTKRNENGSFVIFANPIKENASKTYPYKPYQKKYKRITEISLIPLDKLTETLQDKSLQVLESSPLYTLRDTVFAVVVRREDLNGGVQ